MREGFISLGCWLLSIVLTAALLFAATFAAWAVNSVLVLIGIIVGVSLWAAWDSKRIHLRQYRTAIACSPGVLLVLMLPLWILIFPWYLGLRLKILMGIAERKGRSSHSSRSSRGTHASDVAMARTFGIVLALLGLALLAWVGYNLLIERLPETRGRNPLPAIILGSGMVFGGFVCVQRAR